MNLTESKIFKRILNTVQYIIIPVLSMMIFPVIALAAPPSPLDPASPAARSIANLHNIALTIATLVFAIVCSLLIYALIRYRRKSTEEAEPEQIHGNATLETIWTLIPVGILVVLLVLTFQSLRDIDPNRPTDLTVQVVGRQWLWEVRYPDQNIITTGEMYVPVNTDIRVELMSEDVIHSFWVPQLGGKKDAVPGYLNVTWFKADRVGTFHGQCAEYCGLGHSNMPLQVKVVDQQSFDIWLSAQTDQQTEKLTPTEPEAESEQAAAEPTE
jgi:cytochrome c oxidase subunit 2